MKENTNLRIPHLCLLLLCLAILACAEPPQPASVRIIPVPNGGITPDAVVDDKGVVHLAYFRDDDVYYIRSEDNGQSFSESIRVNSEPETAQAGMFRGPDIDVAPDGRVHVVWYSNAFQRKLPPEEWGVHYASLGPSKAAFTPAQNLNHIPSDNYSIAANQGSVAVVWTADSLYVQTSKDDGRTFSEPEAVGIADPCECCATKVYFSDTGDLYIAYREKADNIRDMHLLVRRAGETSFNRSLLSQTSWQIDACPMSGSYLSEHEDGLVIGWETKGQIFFGRTDTAGQLHESGETMVSEQGKYPVVLTTPDGATLVAWKQNTTLAWRMYDAEGNRLERQDTVSDISPHRPAGVVTSDGTVLLFP